MQIWNAADMETSYGNNILKILHKNTFYFLTYIHVSYVKSVFTNIQKQ